VLAAGAGVGGVGVASTMRGTRT
jgi:hypothetical protein